MNKYTFEAYFLKSGDPSYNVDIVVMAEDLAKATEIADTLKLNSYYNLTLKSIEQLSKKSKPLRYTFIFKVYGLGRHGFYKVFCKLSISANNLEKAREKAEIAAKKLKIEYVEIELKEIKQNEG